MRALRECVQRRGRVVEEESEDGRWERMGISMDAIKDVGRGGGQISCLLLGRSASIATAGETSLVTCLELKRDGQARVAERCGCEREINSISRFRGSPQYKSVDFVPMRCRDVAQGGLESRLDSSTLASFCMSVEVGIEASNAQPHAEHSGHHASAVTCLHHGLLPRLHTASAYGSTPM